MGEMSVNRSVDPHMSSNVDSPFDNIATFQLPTLIRVTSCGMFVVIIAAILIDIEILLTFVRRPRLITPFSIYVVNVIVINLVTATVYDPIMLQRNLNREWFRGNPSICGTYKYLQWTTISLSALQHCIICGDRWLAVLRPAWYRRKTVSFGVKAVLVALIYQQIWYLPLFITDVVQEQSDLTRLCDLTKALLNYQYITRTMTVLLPQAVMFISYPCLLWRIWARKRVGIQSASVIMSQSEILSSTPVIKHQKKPRNELKLALWSVALQVVFWMPFNVMSILANVRSSLPYFIDIHAFFFMFATLPLLVDPLIFLIFSTQLRKEIVLHLGGLCVCSGFGRRNSSEAIELSTSRQSNVH